ncbi:hypothetical protein OA92_05345 [Marinomonas sp. SBI22]|uniref:response regulator n=1 Tax=unclassified Marinomonas TaxID=196814 RepID=UPI0007AF2516|nr:MULTISPECIES: response regulator [unclassified Marinomonas]KZM44129.1 hypothetical protein OA92_05345 [Marinomonas sp. SBI22]KZM45288.1 hypothetical protein OA91_06490 [Marinomonas sp. SBI8L]
MKSASMTILVVEDHDFSRKQTLAMLLRVGFENVLSAKNGDLAIERLNQHKIDLVITDINMPSMNGMTLIKQIRLGKTKNNKALKIIAVTSYSNIKVITTCMELDIDGFLVKPLAVKPLTEKINSAVLESSSLYHEARYQDVETIFDSLSDDTLSLAEVDDFCENASLPSLEGIQSIPNIKQLKEGMVLVEGIFTKNGSCLICAGIELNEKHLNRLIELESIVLTREIKVTLASNTAVT